jgi:hypothetical protein
MPISSETYASLNKEWNAACRIILGGEIGELDDYSEWLSSLNDQFFVRQSTLSGKEVVFSNGAYCQGSEVVSMDEVDFMRKEEPLSINDMKDIDSLFSAVSERASYCGNIVLGNSKFVERSTSVTDSFFIYKSVKISGSKNIAYSQYLRLCENVSGTNEGGASKFAIRSSVLFNNARGFEMWICGNSADIIYSYGLEDCRDCIFSFNLIGKSHCIGNVPLPKEKYLSIKADLLSQMRGELVKKKKLPSLIEIVSQAKKDHSAAASLIRQSALREEQFDKGRAETAFSEVSSVVLGKRLDGMDSYSAWLSRHFPIPYPAESVLSKKMVQMSNWPGISMLPRDRLVTQQEAIALGEAAKISQQQAEGISLANARESIGAIAYFPPERRIGVYKNLLECQWGSGSSDCYKVVICALTKLCGYSSWPRSSDHCFGCGIIYESEFCMRSHDAVGLKRCFEMDSSRDCSDSWFCHNVEALQNCMFCFNIKNKQYAIANAEVGREQYSKVKKMVVDWINAELEKENGVPLSIYDFGCQKKAKR